MFHPHPSSTKVCANFPATASQDWTKPSRATVTTLWASGEKTANSKGMEPEPPQDSVR
jgi:hypothetical protein